MKGKILISTTLVTLLSACIPEPPVGPPVQPLVQLAYISPAPAGYQTFSEYGASVSTNNRALRTSPRASYQYVYLNQDRFNSQLIDFKTVDGESSAQFNYLLITDVRDINSRYAAITFADVSVEVNGQIYSGGMTLIQDKQSGAIYPLFDQGQPIAYETYAEHEAWRTSTRFSSVSDTDRLYLRYGSGRSLHVAELSHGTFHIKPLFDDYLGDSYVDDQGQVWRKDWDGDFYWYQPEMSTPKPVNAATEQQAMQPLLLNGEFYALLDNSIWSVSVVDDQLILSPTSWTASDYQPSPNSVRRAEFEMANNCAIYRIDQQTQQISLHAEGVGTTGAVAAADHTLFCAYDDGSEHPKFIAFDTQTETSSSFVATAGVGIDATERLSVISEKEVMFYSISGSARTEYFVRTDETETQVVINDYGYRHIITHLRLP